MSVRVMTAVWALDLPAGEKLLLLALADCANDEGRCWPGMKSLKLKTGKCERSLQAAIKSLCAAGHLTRDDVPGKGCNYTVHPRNNCTPAITAPPQKLTQTPAEIAGKPLRTIKTEAKASLGAIPEAWNEMAGKHGNGRIRILDNSRKQKLLARLKEHGEAVMLEAVERVGRSRFLTGRGVKTYKANFDFILQPESLRKLLEDFYEDAADRPVANDAPKTMLEQIQLEQKWKRQAGGIA